ncbi:hypothetical protein FB451DRAFT_1405900 [Mycena latifolia]|nr:hypothetical protein FB451DRAFT_1405900 [Mycena latifolia]
MIPQASALKKHAEANKDPYDEAKYAAQLQQLGTALVAQAERASELHAERTVLQQSLFDTTRAMTSDLITANKEMQDLQERLHKAEVDRDAAECAQKAAEKTMKAQRHPLKPILKPNQAVPTASHVEALLHQNSNLQASLKNIRESVKEEHEAALRAKDVHIQQLHAENAALRVQLASFAAAERTSDPRKFDDQRPRPSESELERYTWTMEQIPPPTYHPNHSSETLVKPIWDIHAKGECTAGVKLKRQTADFSGRQRWIAEEGSPGPFHALMYAPTQQFDSVTGTWSAYSGLKRFCGEEIELFDSRPGTPHIHYVGVYVLRRLQESGDVISECPNEVSHAAIIAAAGAKGHEHQIALRFPDGKIPVQCWGLVCRGFNCRLYEELRTRYKALKNKPNNVAPRTGKAEESTTARRMTI